jgi:hypothetical protein
MKSIKNIFLLFLSIIYANIFFAQADTTKNWAVFPKPKVTIVTSDSLSVKPLSDKSGMSKTNAPAEVETITEELRQKSEPKTKGYRLQVFLSQDKDQVMKIKAEFIKNFDDVEVYVDRKAPNYVLKVGDFYNRFDANAYKMKISSLYPNAIVVGDDIQLPKIVIEEKNQNSNE